jgi:TPR repeat protein
MFFGFGQPANKEASIEIYEESAQLECSKAILALAAIYEPTDSGKAFEYYDLAAETEPYALMKLGDFMETGLYEEGFRGKKNTAFALGFYKRAT